MPGQHALLSASSSHRWMNCPASVLLSKDIPEQSSPYAEEGTRAHALAESYIYAILAGHRDIFLKAVPEDMAEMFGYVKDYVAELENVGNKPLEQYDFVQAEVRLPLESITGEPASFGTADCLIVDGKHLWVCDLKYGMGVKVEAERNTQLLMYAVAAKEYLQSICDIERASVMIVQPRLHACSTWDVTAQADELLARLKRQAARALAIVKDPGSRTDADFGPSNDVCHFCKAKLHCKAVVDALNAEVVKDFDVVEAEKAVADRDVVLTVPNDPDKLARAYRLVPLLRYWADAVEAEAMGQASAGRYLPGFKLVEGRAGQRRWTDDAAILKAARELFPEAGPEDLVESKVLSPAKLEKRLKALNVPKDRIAGIAAYITRPSPKAELVPENDKRPALASGPTFEVIEQ